MATIVPIAEVADSVIEHLLDRAFGFDRHGRTAYVVRAGTAPIANLSFAVCDGTALIGSIQCWPVVLNADDGQRHPMTMVGPVAVDPAHQRAGLGHRLVSHMLTAAEQTGADRALMLIGDPEYYSRFFGFSAERTARWRLPGPVLRHRLLARGDEVPDVAGMLGPG